MKKFTKILENKYLKKYEVVAEVKLEIFAENEGEAGGGTEPAGDEEAEAKRDKHTCSEVVKRRRRSVPQLAGVRGHHSR